MWNCSKDFFLFYLFVSWNLLAILGLEQLQPSQQYESHLFHQEVTSVSVYVKGPLFWGDSVLNLVSPSCIQSVIHSEVFTENLVLSFF